MSIPPNVIHLQITIVSHVHVHSTCSEPLVNTIERTIGSLPKTPPNQLRMLQTRIVHSTSAVYRPNTPPLLFSSKLHLNKKEEN